jgi:hypothetical protein
MKSELERRTRIDLNKLLASMSEQAINTVAGSLSEKEKQSLPPKIEAVMDAAGNVTEVKSVLPSLDEKVAAKQLYFYNQLIVGLLEKSSVRWRDYIGLDSDLDGWGKEIEKQRADLEACLVEIYRLHKPMIMSILTPYHRYAFIMIASAGGRLQENYKKREDPLMVSTSSLPSTSPTHISQSSQMTSGTMPIPQ